jgi:glycosyltransferase involved in cell wall biosynthesis
MKISVYITSYNQKAFLKEAIESVLAQTYPPFEIIIVDDCSTDGSQELIRTFAEKHSLIKPIFHQENLGVAQVRVTALNHVTGDYVTYVDGDDLYLPHKLEIEAAIIQAKKCDVAFSNTMYVDAKDITDIKWIWAANQFKLSPNLFAQTISRDFPRNSLFRMELINYQFLKSIGFHDTKLEIYEDFDLRIRIAQRATMAYSLEPTSKIRISTHGLSKRKKEEHINAYNYIYNKYTTAVEQLDLSLKHNVLQKMKENIEGLKREKIDLCRKSFKLKFKEFAKRLIDKI